MSPESVAYPFLFIAIYFEVFILVTLLSKPAREARRRAPHALGTATPSVAVIVPCYNEEATVARTAESLLALDYPADKLEVILVDDGSTDGTPAAMARYAQHPQVRVIRKENGGKHTALNAGIAMTHADFIGCLDADSFVEPDALREIMPSFTDGRVAATTAAMSVYEPKKLIEHMQHAEYVFGITFRHAIASVNGIYVTPGPFSFYRRSVLEELGGFRYGYQTEDMEMALRIQQAGYRIENAPHARVYTKVPDTVGKLIKQRVRWTTGFLRNISNEYRGLVGSRRHGALGVLVLPTALLAIGSGILLFFLMLFQLTQGAITTFQLNAGIPLAYSLTPRGSLDWFYLPATFYTLLGIAALIAALSLILVGRRLSRTPGTIALGLVSYTLFYGFVVPLWLVGATADVAFGKRRSWR
ncbi:MAG TPA: glycosyltransferase [Candidatus Paceibacterota bacterium]|nr:glycosyltransferase [Candidatus Paceibacterota bacterium]